LAGQIHRADTELADSELADSELAQLVELVRALIRIKTVNPPGDELLAARYLEGVLADEGIQSTVVEPFPGRGSIVARLRGDGTGGEPLLLLSHLDVVPAGAPGSPVVEGESSAGADVGNTEAILMAGVLLDWKTLSAMAGSGPLLTSLRSQALSHLLSTEAIQQTSSIKITLL